VTGIREFVEICSDEEAAKFRKDVVIPYFKDIFKVNFLTLVSCRILKNCGFKTYWQIHIFGGKFFLSFSIQNFPEFLENVCSQFSMKIRTQH